MRPWWTAKGSEQTERNKAQKRTRMTQNGMRKNSSRGAKRVVTEVGGNRKTYGRHRKANTGKAKKAKYPLSGEPKPMANVVPKKYKGAKLRPFMGPLRILRRAIQSAKEIAGETTALERSLTEEQDRARNAFEKYRTFPIV